MAERKRKSRIVKGGCSSGERRTAQAQSFGGPFWDGHDMYGPTGSMGILRTPEQQFVDVLMQLKRAKLAENAEDAHRFYRNRLQLHVVMTNIEPVLYRRLTVPAGITLQVGGECCARHVSERAREQGCTTAPPLGPVWTPKLGPAELGPVPP